MKRFVYISAPGSNVAHYHEGKLLEGERVRCGQRLQKGWAWAWAWAPLGERRRCKRCFPAAP